MTLKGRKLQQKLQHMYCTFRSQCIANYYGCWSKETAVRDDCSPKAPTFIKTNITFNRVWAIRGHRHYANTLPSHMTVRISANR